MTYLAGGKLFTNYSDHPRKLVTLNPTQINRRRTLPAFSVGGMPTATAWPERTSLRKVGTLWHCSRLRSVALYLIDRGDIRQAIDRYGNIWASLPGAGYGQFERRRQPDCKIQRSGRNSQLMYEQVTAIISALVIYIIVCLSWAVNHYRDNAITYKAQRDKNMKTEAVNSGTDMQDASA